MADQLSTKDRLIRKDSLQEMSDLLQKVAQSAAILTIWELNSKGQRKIIDGHIDEIDRDKGQIIFNLKVMTDVFRTRYVYVHDKNENMIFKANIVGASRGRLQTEFPYEIRFIREEKSQDSTVHKKRSKRDFDILNNQIVQNKLDAEDQQFGDVRESPRLRPKIDKFVEVEYETDYGPTRTSHILHDLSQGGMGFLVLEKDHFVVGHEISLTSLDREEFDVPMKGIIRAVVATDDLEVQYKVGVQFTQ